MQSRRTALIFLAAAHLFALSSHSAQAKSDPKWHLMTHKCTALEEGYSTPEQFREALLENNVVTAESTVRHIRKGRATIVTADQPLIFILGRNECRKELLEIQQYDGQIRSIVESFVKSDMQSVVEKRNALIEPEGHVAILDMLVHIAENYDVVYFADAWLWEQVLTGESNHASRDSLEEGIAFLDRGDLTAATRLLVPLAFRGSPAANFHLAEAFYKFRAIDEGFGLLGEYHLYLAIAAGLHDANSVRYLGFQHSRKALGAPHFSEEQKNQMIVKSVYYIKEYAQAGDAIAQHRIGWFYRYRPEYIHPYNMDERQNGHAAFDWFAKSAKQDDPYGAFELAKIYFDPPAGFERNVEKGMRLLQVASNLGHPSANEYSERYLASVQASEDEGREHDECLLAAQPQSYVLKKLHLFESIIQSAFYKGGRCETLAEGWNEQLQGLKDIYESKIVLQYSSNDPSWCGTAKTIRHYEDVYRQQLGPNCL